MTFLLTSDALDALQLSLVRKKQKNSSATNVYFSPNIGIKLYRAKVLYVNPKYIVFQFDKSESLGLCILLRKISDFLRNQLRSTYYDLKNKLVHDIISETETTFTIRCNLPGSGGRYYIGQDSGAFNLPRVNAVFGCVLIEFRNYWEQPDKIGMNTEVKFVWY